jgi:hypothetical protein
MITSDQGENFLSAVSVCSYVLQAAENNPLKGVAGVQGLQDYMYALLTEGAEEPTWEDYGENATYLLQGFLNLALILLIGVEEISGMKPQETLQRVATGVTMMMGDPQ